MDHQSNCNNSNCAHTSTNKSVQQTISEMDWERGIWNAAFNGEINEVQKIIDKSRNSKGTVNAPDNSGYTALHYAARREHIDVCKLLLRFGADVNAQTKSGQATPLHKAASAGKKDSVKFLIESGAKVDMPDIDGETALHKAIENRHYDLKSILLEYCPELANMKDCKGRLALEPTLN